MQNVIIRNKAGLEKTITQRAWDLMASKLEPDDTRKGWTRVGKAEAKPIKGASPMGPRASYLPEEIREEQARNLAEAEKKALTGMIAGAQPEAPAAEAAAPEAQQQAAEQAPAAPAAEPEKTPQPPAEPKQDDIAAIPGIGPKAAEALAGIGIVSFAALASAESTAIMKALDGVGLAAKKAQVPNWKQEAAKRSTK
jgi:predicted flap endonuclease-1-like 5' DNA nuclease